MKFNNTKSFLSLLLIIFGLVLNFTSCDFEEKMKAFDRDMARVSKTIKTIDSTADKVSKGVSKFSKHVEKYIDTTVSIKDSFGHWHKKD